MIGEPIWYFMRDDAFKTEGCDRACFNNSWLSGVFFFLFFSFNPTEFFKEDVPPKACIPVCAACQSDLCSYRPFDLTLLSANELWRWLSEAG